MPVQPQLIPIPFTGGVDTKSDPKQVMAGNLLELQNGVFTKKGQISKRFGYDVLGTDVEGGGSITAAKAISSFEDELVLFDGRSVYTLLESTGNWVNRGTAISVIAHGHQILRSPTDQQLNPDVAYLDGVELYAWEDDRGGVRCAVVDSETRAFIVSDAEVDSTDGMSRPKCLSFDGMLVVLYTDGTSTLYVRTVDPANPTVITTAVAIALDQFANSPFDACVVGSKLFVGYNSTVSTQTIRLAAYDSGFIVLGAVTVSTDPSKIDPSGPGLPAGTGLAVCGTAAQDVWVMWNSLTGHIRGAAYGYTLATVLADSDVTNIGTSNAISIIERPDIPGTIQIAVDKYSTDGGGSPDVPGDHRVYLFTFDALGDSTFQGKLYSVGLAAKLFANGQDVFAVCTHESPLQSTYFVALADAAKGCPIIAKTSAGVGGGLRTNHALSESVTTAANVVLFAHLTKGAIDSEGATLFELLGVSSTTLDFSHPNKFLSATSAGNLLIVGGILQSYDGVSVTEHGFHLFPELTSDAASASGSDGFLSTGTYQYSVCYRWTDGRGLIQRSAPSVPVSVDVTALNHVNLVIPCLGITQKQPIPGAGRQNVILDVYRTQANGTVFNRVSSIVAPEENGAAFHTKTFEDTMSDSDALSGELLYTTGGVLNNIAPPAHSLMSLYQNRIILSGMEDPNLIWFSKNRFDNTNFNTSPIEFSDANVIGVDPKGGDITALGLLDDKLIIFKRAAIFILSGDGPNDTGGGDQFADPQFATTDVGCKNPNSVVQTPLGLMFQSDKGIYLLDRSLSAQYIGAPVEAFNASEITSATLDADANVVIFTTSDNVALVYDYYYSQWSTWTNHEAEDSDSFGGEFCFVKSDGRVFKQNKTSFTDGTDPVYLSFTTPNHSFAGLSGFQRIFRAFLLGTYKGPHTLNVSVAYDYADTYAQTAAITAGATYEYRIDFKQQRATAVRMHIEETQVPTYNEGFAITSLTFEVGVMPRGTRVPTSRTVGTA